MTRDRARDMVIGWRTVGAVARLLALAAILVAAIFFLKGAHR